MWYIFQLSSFMLLQPKHEYLSHIFIRIKIHVYLKKMLEKLIWRSVNNNKTKISLQILTLF